MYCNDQETRKQGYLLDSSIKCEPKERYLWGIVSDVTFAHFGETCSGRDRMFCTNPMSHDLQHPIELMGISADPADNVDVNSVVFIERPDVT